jgi:hypothetical protein
MRRWRSVRQPVGRCSRIVQMRCLQLSILSIAEACVDLQVPTDYRSTMSTMLRSPSDSFARICRALSRLTIYYQFNIVLGSDTSACSTSSSSSSWFRASFPLDLGEVGDQHYDGKRPQVDETVSFVDGPDPNAGIRQPRSTESSFSRRSCSAISDQSPVTAATILSAQAHAISWPRL